jgi:hypothetical protein
MRKTAVTRTTTAADLGTQSLEGIAALIANFMHTYDADILNWAEILDAVNGSILPDGSRLEICSSQFPALKNIKRILHIGG